MIVERGISIRIGIGMVLLLGGAGSGLAGTLTVCPSGCSHTTIQGAVVAANPGDTIQILSSTHTEGDIFLSKDIIVEGYGPWLTIVQAHASPGVATVPVFIVTGGSDVVVKSLVIRHGGGDDGGGVYIQDGTLTLEDVDVMYNTALIGGGVFVSAFSTLRASGASIRYNTAESKGGGVAVEGTAELVGSTIDDNTVSGTLSGSGAGIHSEGTLRMRTTSVSHNNASSTSSMTDGIGIDHRGPSLSIADSVIEFNISNSSSSGGGGIILTGSGTATIRNSTISEHEDEGIYSLIPTLLIEDCTVSANGGRGLVLYPPAGGLARIVSTTVSSNSDGGMSIGGAGSARVTNTTVTWNTAFNGGGGILSSSPDLQISNSTIVNNTADSAATGLHDGGGIYVDSGSGVVLRNTIVANNHDLSPPLYDIHRDCSGIVQSGGYNLIRYLSGCTVTGDTTGNLYGAGPMIAGLADNGGPTQTHALLPGSPAENAGNPAGCADPAGYPLDVDQRHGIREDRCDIGSFELSAVFFRVFSDGFESGDTWFWSSSTE